MGDLARLLGPVDPNLLIVVGLVACFAAGIGVQVLRTSRRMRRLRAELQQAQQAALHEQQSCQSLLKRLNDAQESIGAQMQLARETRASLEGCVTRRDREIRDLP